ncbi:MAG: hypothetical protein B6241_04035 [Spirochaetaceae bacterium 4572_59]|nr:MAG: hypothetical protein B6241_04035 [Spirochaetaceae bacterium 4572_59]
MDIEILPAGPLQTNSYLIMKKESSTAIVVDAGPESYNIVMEEAAKHNVKIEALLISHPHWDHIMDLHLFVKEGIPVYAHKDAVAMIEDPSQQASMAFPGMEFHPGKVDHVIEDKEILQVDDLEMEVRYAPGHCPGSVMFYFRSSACCFTGDVIFDGSVGRSDLPGGDMNTLKESILGQVYSMSDDTILYPGHGSSTLVGKEKISNPFIKA